ncbi:MAG: serine/threonine protein kinase [Polyangiaceae bacterium]|nr:serine/threonine protein kinase [Polyangiaceae bacterium]
MSTETTFIRSMFASVPFDTKEANELLRNRLSFFAGIAAATSCFVTLMGIAHARVVGHIDWTTIAWRGSAGIGLAALLPGVAWLILRARAWSPRALAFFDAGIVLAVLAGQATQMILAKRTDFARFDLIIALVSDLLLLSRAIIVPSRPKMTLVVSLLGALPSVAVAFVVGGRLQAAGLEGAAISTPLFGAAWGTGASLLATLASQVIYGLRSKVAASKKLGPYELDEMIGQGGMGAVFLARHALLRRPTAVKLLLPEAMGTASLERFEREVQHTARLTHPNTVAIYDYGRTPNGVFYYAMEYLDGADLQRLVDKCGPLDPRRAVHVLLQICGALAEAHGAGLVHRDLKPANVLLCERGGVADVAKVLDFGLVKRLDSEDTGTTAQFSLIGTPSYLAPEAILSAKGFDTRSDVYAVAALGYFLLSGTAVFEGRTVVEVCARHLTDMPVPLSVRAGDHIPRELDALLLQCLSKDAGERPRDAAELRQKLLACCIAPWSENEATEWWSEHRAELARDAQAKRKSDEVKTVEVDVNAIVRSRTLRSSRTLPGQA